MQPLRDVAKEWEGEAPLRDHVRHAHTLLQWKDTNEKKINIRNADLNFLVLKPLARRLKDSTGEVGMHRLPQIQSQKLGGIQSKHIFDILCFIVDQVMLVLVWGS